MITSPIWKDTYYETDAAELAYGIYVDNELVFAGKAFRLPSANLLRININKICRDYLSLSVLDFFTGLRADHSNAIRDFVLKNADGNVLETYRFFYDWSYEPWNGQTTMEVSKPINGHYAAGMMLMGTVYELNSKAAYTIPNQVGYKTPACGDYALYYLNIQGGWDAFLIEGNVVKSDKITQHTYGKVFDNNTMEFEKTRYASDVVTSYEMSTGWLTDEQAENFTKNLIGSNITYLHNLRNDTIIPVVITDNTAVYKTYTNQGHKMVNYSLKVEESQTKLRK